MRFINEGFNMDDLKEKNLIPLELSATILYAVSVFLFGFNPEISNPLVFKFAWIFACIACPLYVLFFYHKKLYSYMSEMAMYIPLNLIGLFGVLFYNTDFVPPEIELSILILASIGLTLVAIFTMRGLSYLFNKFDPKLFARASSPWLDAITTGMSLVATFLLIIWSPLAWVLWIIINILAIVLFIKNKAYIVMISYILYLVNAFRSAYNWGLLEMFNLK